MEESSRDQSKLADVAALVSRDLFGAEQAVAAYLETGNHRRLAEYEESVRVVRRSLASWDMSLRDAGISGSAIERLHGLFDERLSVLRGRIRAFVPVGSRGVADDAGSGLTLVLEEFDSLTETARTSLDSRYHEEQRRAEAMGRFVIAATAGGIVMSAGGSFVVMKPTVRRLHLIARNARKLQNGETLEPVADGNDELDDVCRSLSRASVLLAEKERRLRKATKFLEHLVVESPVVAIKATFPDFRIRYVSSNVERVFVHSIESLQETGDWLAEFIYAEDQASLRQTLDGLSQSQPRSEWKGRLRCGDGSFKWVEATIRLEADGDDLFVLGYFLDVDARIKAEGAERESRERLHAFLDNTPAVVTIKDLAGRYLVANEMLTAVTGRNNDEIVGRTDEEIYPANIASMLRNNDVEVIKKGTAAQFEEVLPRDGGGRTFLSVKFPLRDIADNTVAVCAVSTDISERRAAEDEARRARAEAEAASLAKTEFLSRVSHELRTPLNSVLGFGQLLELGRLDAAQREHVRQILRGGTYLLDLIDELLDISGIESGKLKLCIEAIEVRQIVQDCMVITAPLAETRKIELVNRVPPRIFVRADPNRFRQALLNLLSNAVKYNHVGGGATVRCKSRRAGTVHIEVVDGGPGIAAEDLERAFIPFERLGPHDQDVTGTGLGLALTRTLMEAMGGTVGVESRVGVGSTFWIELEAIPSARASCQHPEPLTTVSALPMTADECSLRGVVLYVEDNLANLRVLQHLFAGDHDLELLSAREGALATGMIREHRPDVVLLDLHLPDMTGEEVLRRIRQDPAIGDTTVVVLSADAAPTRLRELALRISAGCDGGE